MTPTDSTGSSQTGKGKAFFDRADQVAMTGNWDFAIEMYLEGIQREPDNMERGHIKLREIAMNRKAKGGKAAGMMDQLKRRAGKDLVQNLINAEFLLSKDPGSSLYMEQVLAAARKLESPPLVRWIASTMMEGQRLEKKRNMRILKMLVDVFEGAKEFESAMLACQMARELDPENGELSDKMRRLSTNQTIQKGKWDQGGDFTDKVKDIDLQKELAQKDSAVKDKEFLELQVTRTRKAYLEDTTAAGKVNAFADALLKFETEGYENEAADVMMKAFRDVGAYAFKMRVDDIKIRQKTRRFRSLTAGGDKAAAAQQAREQLEFELQVYIERAANYPTDLNVKFELGRRLFLSGQIDDAIGAFQQSQRDPRRHVHSLLYLGQAFEQKGWLRESLETYERAMEVEMGEERRKEVLYHLGDVCEKMNNYEKAREYFSQLAQLEYGYRDVSARLDSLRAKIGGGENAPKE